MISLSAASFAYYFLSAEVFDSATSGILSVFSILAGLVAQSMVFTAMLVSPEKLPITKAKALRLALERQQKFWLKQFRIYMCVCVAMLLWILAIKQWEDYIKHGETGKYFMAINIFIVTYGVVSAFSFPKRVIGLQRLRFDVMEDEIKSV